MLDKLYIIIGVIIGLVVGAIGGYITNALQNRVLIAELERDRDRAVLEKVNMQQQWQIAVNELNQTRVLLNDTLASLELLRRYQLIDDRTRRDINKIEETLDPEGEPTEETYDEFRKFVEEMNKQFREITTRAPDPDVIVDFTPFEEIRRDAEKLLDKSAELLFQYKED